MHLSILSPDTLPRRARLLAFREGVGGMNVAAIVNVYLKDNDFDGLWNPDGECACLVDAIAPCGDMSEKCEAGWKHRCHCGEHDYHIGKEKRGRIRRGKE